MKKLTGLVFCLSVVNVSLVGCGGGSMESHTGTGGTGGGTTTSTTSSSTGGHGGEGGHGGQGGHGGGPMCTNPATDCPDPGTSCITATCDAAGQCATQNASADTVCADGGGKVCDGNGACVECTNAGEHCPAPPNECVLATCAEGACGTTDVADGTLTSNQLAGDCKREVCDGAGATKVIDDDDPSDDGNDCTIDTCSAGANVHTNADAGAACATNGGKVCGAGTKAGTCVECVADSDCMNGNVCDVVNDNFVCVPPTCQDDVKNGSETSTDCGGPVCGPCGEGEACMVAADCTTKLCASGVCTACGADGDCLPGEFCNTTTGVCTADQTNGATCTADAQCTSGHCADGVCCDTACAGTCNACSAAKKGQGIDGVCGPIASGKDPDDECATDAASSCGKTGVCDGSGACAVYSAGTVCAAPSCSGGVLQTADTCNGAGTCVDSGSTSCGAYQCNPAGTACLTSCGGDTDCANLSYCNAASQCVAKLAPGAACGGSNQCVSGNCVDGVCCNTACNGVCEACSKAKKGQGADGVCASIAAGSDPDDECATDAASSCGKTGVCNGAGACALYAAGTMCAAQSCSNGVQQNADSCNGGGVCLDGGSTSCGAYQCNAAGTACLTSCAGDSECATGTFCNASSQCVPQLAVGGACSAASQCANGTCVDGFCCNTACSGTCQACSAAKTGGANGVCGNVAAGTDPDNECAGAFSCNGAGACQSCSDGVKDGDETGVDCGGSCAACGTTAATAGLSCSDLLQKGPGLASGIYWIKPAGTASAFQAYCDMTMAGGGWTLLLSATASGTYWGNNSDNWRTSGTTGTTPSAIDINAADYKSDAYNTLVTNDVRLCFQDTTRCHTFAHAMNRTLLSFFVSGVSYTEYASLVNLYPDTGSDAVRTAYLAELGFTETTQGCHWLGINHLDPIDTTVSGFSAIGLMGDVNSGCGVPGSFAGRDNTWLDDAAIGVGLQSCYDANDCSPGGTGHHAGTSRGVNGVDVSGDIGPWFVFAK